MLWFRQPLILLAAALIVANAECVVRCSALPCHDSAPASQSKDSASAPPCHKHHGPKQTDTLKPCTSAALLVAQQGPSTSAINASDTEIFEVAAPLPLLKPWVRQRPAASEGASPPGLTEALSSTVLKI
jgi:hypothetical protein